MAQLEERPATDQATAAHSEPLVELSGVARRYDMGEVTVSALEGIDLRVERGEFAVVLGPSGSGKTTLLNVIGALDSPTEGTVRIAGEDISRASRAELFAFRRHTVSFIFQTFNLLPALTALENVEFGADVSGRGEAREVARQTLERVGLGRRAGHFPHELSGGEQQRVAIARALATRNPILLADEPTGELDFHTGVQILELLHEQTHTEETAVLVVTHNREIARAAHRVIEISSGRIVADAPNPGGPAHISELRW
jgi:putative ABC transport system ATP-binding protein